MVCWKQSKHGKMVITSLTSSFHQRSRRFRLCSWRSRLTTVLPLRKREKTTHPPSRWCYVNKCLKTAPLWIGPRRRRAAELQALQSSAAGLHEIQDSHLHVHICSAVSILKYLALCLKILPKLLRDLKIILECL